MFDLSITKLLVLGVIAIVIFGPDQLPRIAAQAARALATSATWPRGPPATCGRAWGRSSPNSTSPTSIPRTSCASI